MQWKFFFLNQYNIQEERVAQWEIISASPYIYIYTQARLPLSIDIILYNNHDVRT